MSLHTSSTAILFLWSGTLIGCAQTDDKQHDTNITDATAPEPAPCPEGSELSWMSTHGCVIGTESNGLEYFLNIPYASPPVDDLRWKRPVSSEVWTEPLDASTAGNFCVQQTYYGIMGSEDCLNLNIMRPTDNADSPLPILFFTHGGSYTNGSGIDDVYISNPQLAQNAIVVTHNYRLNAFGFLAHPDLTAEDAAEHGNGSSGNQGLFDTLMALEWVYDNAESFGGNPRNIMIFGESAGATSTCALLASPLAAGLFDAAILQSANCQWFPELDSAMPYAAPAENLGQTLADALGCTGSNTLECLREQDAQDVINAFPPDSAEPNVDGVFLNTHPTLAIAYGNFNQVPIVAGVTGNEGSMFVRELGLQTAEDLEDTLLEWGPFFGLLDTDTLQSLYSIEEYGSAQEAFDQFYADLIFVCPTKFLLDSASPYVETYGYHYTHVPSWIDLYPYMEGWGSYHSSELPFVFGTFLDTLTAEEQTLSSQLQEAWMSVANGSPSLPSDTPWLKYDSELENGGAWAQWDTTGATMVTGVKKDNCDYIASQWWQ